jgi:hypothetical protein
MRMALETTDTGEPHKAKFKGASHYQGGWIGTKAPVEVAEPIQRTTLDQRRRFA